MRTPLSFAGSKESGKENSLAGRMVCIALFTPRKGLTSIRLHDSPFPGLFARKRSGPLFIYPLRFCRREEARKRKKGRRLFEPALAGEFRSPPFSGVPNGVVAKPAEAFATDVAERLSFLFRLAGAPGLLSQQKKVESVPGQGEMGQLLPNITLIYRLKKPKPSGRAPYLPVARTSDSYSVSPDPKPLLSGCLSPKSPAACRRV